MQSGNCREICSRPGASLDRPSWLGGRAERSADGIRRFDDIWTKVDQDVATLSELAPKWTRQENRDRLASIKERIPHLHQMQRHAIDTAGTRAVQKAWSKEETNMPTQQHPLQRRHREGLGRHGCFGRGTPLADEPVARLRHRRAPLDDVHCHHHGSFGRNLSGHLLRPANHAGNRRGARASGSHRGWRPDWRRFESSESGRTGRPDWSDQQNEEQAARVDPIHSWHLGTGGVGGRRTFRHQPADHGQFRRDNRAGKSGGRCR